MKQNHIFVLDKSYMIYVMLKICHFLIKWFKEKLAKKKIEVLITCKECSGLGYTIGMNSDYRKTNYWCDCKKIGGKYPNDCYMIDHRWEGCCHTIVMAVDPIDHFLTEWAYQLPAIVINDSLPEPNRVFEPYMKIYSHNGKDIVDKTWYKKELSTKHTDYKKVVWVSLDRFYDDFEYKDIVSIVREQKLKEIGI